MSAFSPRRCAAVVAPVLALGGVLLGAAPASATSPAVLLNEVYGGGGNAGATWRNDFIELFNNGGAAVDLTGWRCSTGPRAPLPAPGRAAPRPDRDGLPRRPLPGAGGGRQPRRHGPAHPRRDRHHRDVRHRRQGRLVMPRRAAGAVGATCSAGAARPWHEGQPRPRPATNTTSATRDNGLRRHRRQRGRLRRRVPHPAEHRDAARGLRAPPPVARPTHPRHPGRGPPVAAGRQAVADVPGVVTAVAATSGFWMQDPTPDAEPGDQRGHLRLHQHRADRRGR